ncbi:MAG: hypothetical protein FWB75_02315 [Oscillospiraceae bacterium]|nr:hypothetical protein [Oscillospiraceae bacterium]
MQNQLITTGIISRSGKVSNNKINLIVGAMTLPFAEMVWVTTNGDRDTVNRLTEVFVTMNTPADRGKLFKIIQMLYGLMGLQFSDEATHIPTHKIALEYFIFSFILDFGEIIKNYITEEQSMRIKEQLKTQ